MRPLEGARIAVTRAAEQADALCAGLETAGAVALRCPTIRVLPPESHDPLDSALRGFDGYGWLLLTSTNGVRSTLGRMAELGLSTAELARVRVAAVGPGTEAALRQRGVRVDLVPERAGSAALARSLEPVEGERVLLIRGDRADQEVERILRERGAARVDSVVAYRTVPTPPSEEALRELSAGLDGITFTSPSTVHGFVRTGPRWRSLLQGAVVASLGPTTTAAALEVGLEVNAEASERTMASLVAALADGFGNRKTAQGGWRIDHGR